MVNIPKNQCAYSPPSCVYVNGAYACYTSPTDCTAPQPVPVGGAYVGALIVLAVIIIGCWALRRRS